MVMIMVMLPYLLLSSASLPISISDYDVMCHSKMCLVSAYVPWASHVGMAAMFSVASFCLQLGRSCQPSRICSFSPCMSRCIFHKLKWINHCMLPIMMLPLVLVVSSCTTSHFLVSSWVSSPSLACLVIAFYSKHSLLEHSSLFSIKHGLINGYTK
jgi:hypothetical protein